MFYEDLLDRFVQMSRAVFGENLVGVYLHGSLAMGCFSPEKSDLDLILVVEDAPTQDEKMRFAQALLVLNEEAPEKGFELSIVKREVCKPFRYPTPFEFHYSNGFREAARADMAGYVARTRGEDKDLGAHFTVINRFGVPLYGPPVEEVFAPVPKKDYFDSIWYDVANARADIVRDPMYIVLNLCRVLGYVRDGLVLSKKTGGEWGVQNLPQPFAALAENTLRCYTADGEITADEDTLCRFADYMTETIKTVWTADEEE